MISFLFICVLQCFYRISFMCLRKLKCVMTQLIVFVATMTYKVNINCSFLPEEYFFNELLLPHTKIPSKNVFIESKSFMRFYDSIAI